MEYKVQIRKYYVNRVSFLMRIGNLPHLEMRDLHEIYGEYVVAINDKIYIDDNLPEKFDVISNNMELPLNGLIGIKNISLYYPKEIPNGNIPEFGFTLCNNISIHQFNMDSNTFFNNIEMDPFYFWGYDKKLYINRWSYSRARVQWYMDRITELGYWAPITLYADTKVQLYNFAVVVYLSKLLNLNTLPIRLMTYVDYKYLENIQPILYSKIKEIPENPYYIKKDEVDVSPILVTKLSEKKATLTSMKTIFPNIPDNFIRYPMLEYTEIPFFIFNADNSDKNWELVNTIASKKYPPVTFFKEDNSHDGLSMCAELFWRLHGKMSVTYKDKAIEVLDYNNDDYEVDSIKEINDFTLFPIEDMSYWKDVVDKETRFAQHFDADFCITDNDTSFLVGIENIHKVLNKDSIKVAYLKHK